MTFLLESIAACALFSLLVFLMSRDPVKTVFNYPPAIIERCRQQGLVDDSNRPGGPDNDFLIWGVVTWVIKKV